MKKISIAILMAASLWGMAQERPQMNDIDADGVELTPVFVGMPAIATDRPDITESAQRQIDRILPKVHRLLQ